MGSGELSGKPDEMPGRIFAMNWHPIQEILLVVSC